MKNLPVFDTRPKDVNDLVKFFETLQSAVHNRGIGRIEITKFDPPRPSCETEPEVLEVLQIEFSPDLNQNIEFNVIGFLDNGRADCPHDFDDEVSDVLCEPQTIVQPGKMPFSGRPDRHMNWSEACAVILSYFEFCDKAKRGGWHPERRKEAFRDEWRVFGLPEARLSQADAT